ncbi:hypothetical protein MNB_SUP05-13-637 [hydrothermal vent metagenome]|jgi:hypothetical protein|uniref:Uncharacterized protein n=1 Tax=hydrothermal vent metagenome TaxID=652676 RepID=A0A1W1DH66_9ZZZZ|nr:hypothetical protein [Piscirickettsiaceae bacterium]
MGSSLNANQKTNELDRLVNREEVLEICYWYQGEGFGDVYNSLAMNTFLKCDGDAIDDAFLELTEQGFLKPVEDSTTLAYQFTPVGKKEGGRLFNASFADLQKAQHGECAAGCCDGDDHSACGDGCTL